MMLRRAASVAVVLGTLVVAAACGGDDHPPTNSPGPDASESPTEPTEPTSTAPAWEKKYTEKQLDAYEAALTRWETYENRSEPIWAEGKATARAEAFFKQYFPSPVWQGYFRRLQSYESADVKVEGTPGVYWSKPKSISDNGLNVEIEQCVDYTQGKTTQAGKPTQVPGWVKKPNLRTITLSKPKGYEWLIYGVVDASSGKARPCAP
jgi:hypothetical protein